MSYFNLNNCNLNSVLIDPQPVFLYQWSAGVLLSFKLLYAELEFVAEFLVCSAEYIDEVVFSEAFCFH